MNITLFLLKWFIGFGYLLDGLIAIFTFGQINSSFTLIMAKKYSRKKSDYILENRIKQ